MVEVSKQPQAPLESTRSEAKSHTKSVLLTMNGLPHPSQRRLVILVETTAGMAAHWSLLRRLYVDKIIE